MYDILHGPVEDIIVYPVGIQSMTDKNDGYPSNSEIIPPGGESYPNSESTFPEVNSAEPDGS